MADEPFYYRNELTVSGSGYFDLAPDMRNYLYATGPQNRTTENVDIFHEGIFSFSDTTRLIAGLRYDYTKVETTAYSCNGITMGGAAPTDCFTLSAADGRRTWNNVTYKARLEHDLSPEKMIYASVASVFIPGSVGDTAGQDPNDATRVSS